MEIGLIIKAVLALIFVLGLLFVTVWGLKYCELKSGNNRFFNKIRQAKRVEIKESARIDLRNSAVLIRCDNTEHLVLLSPGHNLLLESKKVSNQPQAKDHKK